jgi:hypothetical protein
MDLQRLSHWLDYGPLLNSVAKEGVAVEIPDHEYIHAKFDHPAELISAPAHTTESSDLCLRS